jgi:phosphatidylinositol-4,5-bisphosphate 4-phosphatase
MCQVNCGHCNEAFLFNSLVNQLARCPHCEKKSSVGREFARARGLIFSFLAIVALILAIVVTVVTHNPVSDGKKGWIALYVILYLGAIYFFFRSVYFLTMKNSIIIENRSSS